LSGVMPEGAAAGPPGRGVEAGGGAWPGAVNAIEHPATIATTDSLDRNRICLREVYRLLCVSRRARAGRGLLRRQPVLPDADLGLEAHFQIGSLLHDLPNQSARRDGLALGSLEHELVVDLKQQPCQKTLFGEC
jgi:hypothetical protein